jgi:hypothetical protein
MNFKLQVEAKALHGCTLLYAMIASCSPHADCRSGHKFALHVMVRRSLSTTLGAVGVAGNKRASPPCGITGLTELNAAFAASPKHCSQVFAALRCCFLTDAGICTTGFDASAAEVACAQLGLAFDAQPQSQYSYSPRNYGYESDFGASAGPIWMDQVGAACTLSEMGQLFTCSCLSWWQWTGIAGIAKQLAVARHLITFSVLRALQVWHNVHLAG